MPTLLGIDLGTLIPWLLPAGDKFDIYKIPSVVAVKEEDPHMSLQW